MPKTLKARLAAGEAVHGLLSPNVEATTLETLGLVGFSFYILDTEHGPAGPREAEEAARACDVTGMTLLVRPRGLDPKLILQYLDAGAMGIMLPGLRETDEARRLVEAVKYPPKGLRGIAAVRANRWTLGPEKIEDYVTRVNGETLVLPQIETLEAVAKLSELVKVPGVDGFIVGPRDLAMAMGYPGGPGRPEVEAAVDRITKTVLDAGLLIGTVAATGARARELIAKGHRILLHSVTALLKNGAAAYFAAAG
ncbi:MAG: aldolase/citrate lyase family protein [Thermoanaerobaculia bacterium]|jgi:4-hydroxy-2-oxoheptanedioate aldolase